MLWTLLWPCAHIRSMMSQAFLPFGTTWLRASSCQGKQSSQYRIKDNHIVFAPHSTQTRVVLIPLKVEVLGSGTNCRWWLRNGRQRVWINTCNTHWSGPIRCWWHHCSYMADVIVLIWSCDHILHSQCCQKLSCPVEPGSLPASSCQGKCRTTVLSLCSMSQVCCCCNPSWSKGAPSGTNRRWQLRNGHQHVWMNTWRDFQGTVTGCASQVFKTSLVL